MKAVKTNIRPPSAVETAILQDIEECYRATEKQLLENPAIAHTYLYTDAIQFLNKYNAMIRKIQKSLLLVLVLIGSTCTGFAKDSVYSPDTVNQYTKQRSRRIEQKTID